MVFMKLSWEDVCDVFEESAIWENGHDMYWYRLMWALMEYKHMNEYSNEIEKMRIYSRVFAIIKIYTDFIEECFNDDDDELLYVMETYSSDIFEYLYNDSDVHEIFTILNKELGTKRTFYSMFITCIEFENDTDTDDMETEWDELIKLGMMCLGNISDADQEALCSGRYTNDDLYNEYDEEYDEENDDEYEEYDEEYSGYDEEENEDNDEEDDEEDENSLRFEWEDFSEDYYDTFEEYIKVLATSTMSMINNLTPEKAAGYLYLANNMKSEI